MCAEAVAEDLRPDLFLRKREPRPPVARADAAGDGQRRRGGSFDARPDFRRIAHPLEGLADVLAKPELERLVLHLHDALVVEAGEEVEGDGGGIGQLLGDPREGRPGRVPEEVGALGGSGFAEPLLLFEDEARKQRLEGPAERPAAIGGDSLLGLLLHPPPQALELDERLLEAEGLQQSRENGLPGGALDFLLEQSEARRDERFRARELRRQVVVRARVRDPAAERPSLLVQDHGLGRRRAEVDADETVHAVARPGPERRASSIWK